MQATNKQYAILNYLDVPVVVIQDDAKISFTNTYFKNMISHEDSVGADLFTILDEEHQQDISEIIKEIQHSKTNNECKLHMEIKNQYYDVTFRRFAEAKSSDIVLQFEEDEQTKDEESKKMDRIESQELQILYTLSELINNDSSLNIVTERALYFLLELLGLECGMILSFTENSQNVLASLKVEAFHGVSDSYLKKLSPTILVDSVMGKAFQTAKIEFTPNLLKDKKFKCQLSKEEGFKYILAIPLQQDEKIIGMIQLSSKSAGTLELKERTLLQLISKLIGDAVAKAKLKESIFYTSQLNQILMKQNDISVIIVDSDGIIQVASPAFLQASGYKTLRGFSIQDLFPYQLINDIESYFKSENKYYSMLSTKMTKNTTLKSINAELPADVEVLPIGDHGDIFLAAIIKIKLTGKPITDGSEFEEKPAILEVEKSSDTPTEPSEQPADSKTYEEIETLEFDAAKNKNIELELLKLVQESEYLKKFVSSGVEYLAEFMNISQKSWRIYEFDKSMTLLTLKDYAGLSQNFVIQNSIINISLLQDQDLINNPRVFTENLPQSEYIDIYIPIIKKEKLAGFIIFTGDEDLLDKKRNEEIFTFFGLLAGTVENQDTYNIKKYAVESSESISKLVTQLNTKEEIASIVRVLLSQFELESAILHVAPNDMEHYFALITKDSVTVEAESQIEFPEADSILESADENQYSITLPIYAPTFKAILNMKTKVQLEEWQKKILQLVGKILTGHIKENIVTAKLELAELQNKKLTENLEESLQKYSDKINQYEQENAALSEQLSSAANNTALINEIELLKTEHNSMEQQLAHAAKTISSLQAQLSLSSEQEALSVNKVLKAEEESLKNSFRTTSEELTKTKNELQQAKAHIADLNSQLAALNETENSSETTLQLIPELRSAVDIIITAGSLDRIYKVVALMGAKWFNIERANLKALTLQEFNSQLSGLKQFTEQEHTDRALALSLILKIAEVRGKELSMMKELFKKLNI